MIGGPYAYARDSQSREGVYLYGYAVSVVQKKLSHRWKIKKFPSSENSE